MDKVLKILADIRPEFDFTGSQDFIGDGMLDSFDVVTLVSALDETFGISIPGTQILPENFRNLEVIRDMVRRQGGQL